MEEEGPCSLEGRGKLGRKSGNWGVEKGELGWGERGPEPSKSLGGSALAPVTKANEEEKQVKAGVKEKMHMIIFLD